VSPRVVALVAARDEADRVGDTVRALRSIDAVDAVVVVDDGSRDATSSVALAAGAAVLHRGRSAGKGGALEAALRQLSPPGPPARSGGLSPPGPPAAADVWLLADADLGGSAAGLGPVLEPVLAGRADLAVATFPEGAGGGGLGTVRRMSARVVRLLCGFQAREPLSGQRAISARALAAVRPIARGFAVETAMTIDAVRAGLRVVEVPADLENRLTARSVRGFAHRGRQGLDILLAAVPRAVGMR
jgi:glycosyltransferase involved in cell wall biosynthesis